MTPFKAHTLHTKRKSPQFENELIEIVKRQISTQREKTNRLEYINFSVFRFQFMIH